MFLRIRMIISTYQGVNPQLDQKSGFDIYCASENLKQGYLVTQRILNHV